MPDAPRKKEPGEAVSPEELTSLNQEALDHLQKKYGLELHVRTHAAALNEIIKSLGQYTAGGAQKEFDRGFDRTSPGYDKFYNRDRNVDPLDLVSNPAEKVVGPATAPNVAKPKSGGG